MAIGAKYEVPNWLNQTSDKAKKLTAIIGLIVLIAPAIWWLASDNVRSIMRNLSQPPSVTKCVTVPRSGHIIEPAAAGGWAVVTWIGVERHTDCGVPDVTAVVSNGDEVLHDSELSIEGVNYPVGVHDIRYGFKVPDNAKAGRAWLMVTVTYPEAGQSVNSPRVGFIIPDS